MHYLAIITLGTVLLSCELHNVFVRVLADWIVAEVQKKGGERVEFYNFNINYRRGFHL